MALQGILVLELLGAKLASNGLTSGMLADDVPLQRKSPVIFVIAALAGESLWTDGLCITDVAIQALSAFVLFTTLLANMLLLRGYSVVSSMDFEDLLVLELLVAKNADVSGFIPRVFALDVAAQSLLALELLFASRHE